MSVKTVRSEEARLNWRDTLDHAYQGGEVVIERYSKPAAVVVNYDQWQRWRRIWLDMIDQRIAEMDAGNYVPFEEVEAELQAAA
jgi:antitoxin (DNA-binding transcriptional repressor) of toxin-antitoxin stability system